MKRGQLESALEGAVDGESQERLVTSGNRTKAPSLQSQNRQCPGNRLFRKAR